MRESAVMISSTMPSAKYSCSGSPDMFWNGSTASDGLSGSASGAGSTIGRTGSVSAAGGRDARVPIFTANTRIGRAIFLRLFSPMSSKAKSSLSRIWSRTTRLTQMPPGSAKPSRRAARSTPVTEDVAVVDNDVALVDAETELDALISRNTGVAPGRPLLHLDRTAHRIDDTGEFDQEPVALCRDCLCHPRRRGEAGAPPHPRAHRLWPGRREGQGRQIRPQADPYCGFRGK